MCVNFGAMKWKGEAPGMCCPPGEAGHWSLYTIYSFGPHTYLQTRILMTTPTNDGGLEPCLAHASAVRGSELDDSGSVLPLYVYTKVCRLSG